MTKRETKALAPPLALTPQARRFADEFFNGEYAGNATRSYLVLNENVSYANASVEASDLLKTPEVRAYLNNLHERAITATAATMKPWSELVPMAQGIIVATARGEVRNRLAYEAAIHICNRVLGTPVSVASTELIVRDEARILRAVNAFTKRVAEGNRRNLREVAAG
jgi:phage terminase small subunit